MVARRRQWPGTDQRLRKGRLRCTRPRREPHRGACEAEHELVPGVLVGRVARHGGVDRGSDVRPEDTRLVDRLVRADAAELGGAVGGEEHQRRPRHGGLDDGGQELGDRGAAGACDRYRSACCLRDPQGEERGGALVEVDVEPDVGMA
jgi:hypothetical protein